MAIGPQAAREIRLLCPHCSGTLYITLAWPYTSERRTRAISDAVDEHRRLCAKAPPEAKRVYQIHYPR